MRVFYDLSDYAHHMKVIHHIKNEDYTMANNETITIEYTRTDKKKNETATILGSGARTVTIELFKALLTHPAIETESLKVYVDGTDDTASLLITIIADELYGR